MSENNIKDYLSLLEKLVEHNFAYLFVTFIIFLDLDIHIIFGIGLYNLDVIWFQNNIKNIGAILVFIIIFIVYYHMLLPIISKFYYFLIVELMKRVKFVRNKLMPEEKLSDGFIYYGILEQYASLTNNTPLKEIAKEKEKVINNWFQEQETYFSFCIISIIYLFFPNTTLKTEFINLDMKLQVFLYCLFGVFILWKLFTKTMKVPSSNVFIVGDKKAQEINDFFYSEDSVPVITPNNTLQVNGKQTQKLS